MHLPGKCACEGAASACFVCSSWTLLKLLHAQLEACLVTSSRMLGANFLPQSLCEGISLPLLAAIQSLESSIMTMLLLLSVAAP